MVSLVNKKLQKCAHFIYQSMKTAFVHSGIFLCLTQNLDNI